MVEREGGIQDTRPSHEALIIQACNMSFYILTSCQGSEPGGT